MFNSQAHNENRQERFAGETIVSPDPRPRRRWLRWRVRVPLLLIAGAVALAACGSTAASKPLTATPSTATTVPSAPTPSASNPGTANGLSRQAALQAWETCLSQNGVTLPSPSTTAPPTTSAGSASAGSGRGFGGGGALSAVLANPADAAAVTACKSLQPTFGGGGGANATPANRAAYQAYLSCLADNGVTVPRTTPATGSTPAAGGPRVTINQSDPNYAAANAKCKVLLPATTGGATSTTTPTTIGA
jgi:hypothetical protein